MFEDIRSINKEIRRKQEQLSELRTIVMSMSLPLTEKVQTSPQDRLSNLVCKIIDLENELDCIVDNYADLKDAAKTQIFSLDNEEWQDIVYKHYIEHKSFREIAKEKGTTANSVKLKNNRAIKKLKCIIDETL